jgi:glc operon protein GlcG
MEFEKAFEYVTRARELARERGLNVTVAVHDLAGHPVALARGKARSWHGPYMAMGKARLAAAFGKPTSQLVEQWKDRMLFPQSLIEIIPGGITVNPGGYPIMEDGEMIGAIGVGGGSPDQDELIARLASGWPAGGGE